MTLSEIETILEQLALRHPNLDTVLLTTLLSSAGWEEKIIKEATVLFAQRKPGTSKLQEAKPAVAVPTQPSQGVVLAMEDSSKKDEALTFLQPDGSEEGVLPVFTNDVVTRKELPKVISKEMVVQVVAPSIVENKEPKQQQPAPQEEHAQGEIKSVSIHEKSSQEQVPLMVQAPQAEVLERILAHADVKTDTGVKEPESLIVHKEASVQKTHGKNVDIPDNLPLLPFDSSPHVWSFSKYRDMFHKDALYKEEMQVITVMPRGEKSEEKINESVPKKIPEKIVVVAVPQKDEEVSLSKTPLTKGDESLVFLAGMMLFAIILILGYMYSNGRI